MSSESSFRDSNRVAGNQKSLPLYPSSKGGTKLNLINLAKYSTPKRDQFIQNATYEKSKQRVNHYSATEEAIKELEDIYHSLNLSDDEDLMDRAERRDLPSKFQLMKFKETTKLSDDNLESSGGEMTNSSSSSSSSLSSTASSASSESEIQFESNYSRSSYSPSFSAPSSSFGQRYRVDPMEACIVASSHHLSASSIRTPSRRRSAIPDKIGDDLAFRRYSSQPNLRSTMSSSFMDLSCLTPFPSYLLYSSAYIPPIELKSLYNYDCSEPNIDKDDLFYRKLKQADGANVLPPPPPFGIPVCYFCDPNTVNYIHYHLDAKEKKKVYYTVKPSSPHIIKDDMAFRNYRKDIDEHRESPPLLPVTTANVFYTQLIQSV